MLLFDQTFSQWSPSKVSENPSLDKVGDQIILLPHPHDNDLNQGIKKGKKSSLFCKIVYILQTKKLQNYATTSKKGLFKFFYEIAQW